MNMELSQVVLHRRVLKFKYDDLDRYVEPYIHGLIRGTGNEVLSGFQFQGGSQSGGLPEVKDIPLQEQQIMGTKV